MRSMRSICGCVNVALLLLGLAQVSSAAGAQGFNGHADLRKTVEHRGEQFVAAINSDDAAFRARTIREIFAPSTLANGVDEKLLAQLERLHGDLGALEFHHAEAMSMGEGDAMRFSLHVYARSDKDQQWRDLQFMLDPTPPHKIAGLFFIANVAEPVYLPNGDLTGSATREWLNAYLDKLVADEDLAGGLLVASGDQLLFQRTFGYADSARRRPIGPQTRFDMASGGKMFTALAIAQLVEQGRLRFTDTLAKVVPSIADLPFARTVTIGHLLSHTSGIGEFWTDDYERRWHAIRTLQDYLPFIRAAGTHFAPGERFEYSNSNFILAGMIVEAATGEPFDEALRTRIFEPLGMHDTGLFPFDAGDSLQTVRLTGRPRAWRNADHGVRGSSAGGCLTTQADMLRFTRALVAGRIVSTSMLSEMTTSKTSRFAEDSTPYGYGFTLEKTPGGVRSYGHGGITKGVNFELRYFPDLDMTLVAYSNQDNGAYDDLRRNTMKLITGER